MRRATLTLAAATLDAVVGDPEALPHPVRVIGFAIAQGERLLRPHKTRGNSAHSPKSTGQARYDLAAGAILTFTTVAGAYSLTRLILDQTRRLHPRFGDAVEVLLASTCLAARNLDDEARQVLRALMAGDLALARQRLSRIVGRDTQTLDTHGIARALIETLAESACDGVVAPLFYLALGGVPLAMAFKAVSTLDSMIGHRDPSYLYFGRVAARLDDAANLIPARLTAMFLLTLAPARLAVTSALWRRDARKHLSPNAGHPEAAMAAMLSVRLGGPSTYAGEPHAAPLLNAAAPLPTPPDARKALRLVRAVSLLACIVAIGSIFAAKRGHT
jgi:adenosylcobinamide-phosphate synthase